MMKINISNLKRTSFVSRDIRANFANIRDNMKEHEEEMIYINAKIAASRNHVLSEKEIGHNMGGALDIIEAGCQNNFQTIGRQGKPKSCIQEWLGLGSAVIHGDFVEEFADMRMDEENDVNEEENGQVEITEDAAIEHEQRFLELEEEDVENNALKELKEKKERARNNVDFVNIDNEVDNDADNIVSDDDEDNDDEGDCDDEDDNYHHGLTSWLFYITSVSKKLGQSAIVYYYCALSQFF